MKRKVLMVFLCTAALGLLLIPRLAAAKETDKKLIALTFDDGPRPETTEKLLDGLRERGAHATFFVVGENIPGNEKLLRRMAAEGHQIGNHTFRHVRLDQTPDEGRREIERTDTLLRETLGGGGYWVRPPWGFLGKEIQETAATPFLYWSVDPEDWQVRNADTVAQRDPFESLKISFDNLKNAGVE